MQRIVIVGGGAAGIRVVEELVSLQTDTLQITMIDENTATLQCSTPYSSPFDSFVSSRRPQEWFIKNGVTVISEQRVTAIDRVAKIITLENRKSIEYDKLILAVGATPAFRAPTNAKQTLILSARHLYQSKEFEDLTATSKSAMVIGGGLSGIELALKLSALGIEVALFDKQQYLLSNEVCSGVLSAVAAETLGKAVCAAGVNLQLGRSVNHLAAVEPTTDYKNTTQTSRVVATMSDSSKVESDMAVIAAYNRFQNNISIHPVIEIGNQGFVVNGQQQLTNDDHVYAIGGCADRFSSISLDRTALYENVYQLAQIMIGNLPSAKRKASSVRLRCGRVEIALATTLSSKEVFDGSTSVLELKNEVKNSYKNLTYDSNQRLRAGILIGDTCEAGALFQSIANPWMVTDANKLLFGASPPLSPEGLLLTDPDSKVCLCNTVTVSEIEETLQSSTYLAKDNETHERLLCAVINKTRATTGCGSCEGQIRAIITSFSASLPNQMTESKDKVLAGSSKERS